MEVADYSIVEHLGDGRLLVEPVGRPGVLVVVGRSTRPPVAARTGYGRRVPRRREAEPDAAAEAKAWTLFESLLDHDQRAMWRHHRRCWVTTPRGPVRIGALHDLRYRPEHRPGEEWSLCVVPSRPLPMGDVWTNLLLVLSADPDQFFRVASHRGTFRPSRPDPP